MPGNTFCRSLLSTLCFALLLGSGHLSAHSTLMQTEPAEDATLAQAPEQIRLQFSDAIEPHFSVFRLYGLGGDRSAGMDEAAEIPTGSVQVGDNHKRVSLPVSASLRPGWYALVWDVLSTDGHASNGVLRFRIRD